MVIKLKLGKSLMSSNRWIEFYVYSKYKKLERVPIKLYFTISQAAELLSCEAYEVVGKCATSSHLHALIVNDNPAIIHPTEVCRLAAKRYADYALKEINTVNLSALRKLLLPS